MDAFTDPITQSNQKQIWHLDRFVKRYGAVIMRNRVEVPNGFSSDLLTWAKDMVEALLRVQGSESEVTRKQYTKDLCQSIAANVSGQVLRKLLIGQSQNISSQVLPGVIINRPQDVFVPPLDEITSKSPGTLFIAAAAATGNSSIVRQSLETSDTHLFRNCSPFRNILAAAAGSGKVEVMEIILDQFSFAFIRKQQLADTIHRKRVRLKVFKDRLKDALHVAFFGRQKDAGEMLLLYLSRRPEFSGYDFPHLQNYRGNTTEKFAFGECVRCDNSELICSTLRFKYGGTLKASQNDYICILNQAATEILKRLLIQGLVDPNHVKSTTPLMNAIRNHNYRVAKILLKNGADIDGTSKGEDGVTALWHAANAGDKSAVKFLLEHGADPDSNVGWRSPLQAAKDRGHDVIINLLCEAKEARE